MKCLHELPASPSKQMSGGSGNRLVPFVASLAFLTALAPTFAEEGPVNATPAAATASAGPKAADEGGKTSILKPGDPAPPLALGTWFKGEPVEELKKGEFYIIEFWATWCGPCIVAIPHVTELQNKYKEKGLTVIGVCVWDAADDEKVKAFVEKQGDKMGYRVVRERHPTLSATDRAGEMARTWLKPAAQNGIPCSFVVDKEGKIAWIGHPMRLDSVLPQILDGEFDVAKEAESFVKAAEGKLKMEALNQECAALIKDKDFDGALKKLDEMAEVSPNMAGQYQVRKVSLLISEKREYKEANELAAKLIDGSLKDNARLLGSVATLLSRPANEEPANDPRDLSLALKAAERADELTKDSEPAAKAAALAVVAGVRFERGEVDKAIELQTKAVELAAANARRSYQTALDKYTAAQQ